MFLDSPLSLIAKNVWMVKARRFYLPRLICTLSILVHSFSVTVASFVGERPPIFADGLKQLSVARQSDSVTPKSTDLIGALLEDGKSNEFSFSWLVSLETGDLDGEQKLAGYETKLRCNDTSILDGASDCELESSSAEGDEGEDGFAYFSVVAACAADRFPGFVGCYLSLDPPSSSAVSRIESVESTVFVAGFTVYSLEGSADGNVTKDTEIFSGAGRGVVQRSFQLNATNAGLFGVRLFTADGKRILGQDAALLFNEAEISTNETDAIFLYDQASCLPGNFSSPEAEQVAGVLTLAPAETCGFGTAPSQAGYDSVLGVRVRPFKVGRKEMTFTWSDFRIRNVDGSQGVPYSQSFSIEVEDIEKPPPVLQEISLSSGFSDLPGKPCAAEDRKASVVVRAYNVHTAESRTLRILQSGAKGSKEILQEWEEDESSYNYDLLTDSSTFSFGNKGGSGQNLSFELAVQYEGDSAPKIAVPLHSLPVDIGLSFTSPVSVQELAPSVVDFSGGDVVLIGNFENASFESGDRLLIEGGGIAANTSVEILSQNYTHIIFVAPSTDKATEPFSAKIALEICGSTMGERQLTYGVPPRATIWSVDLSPSQTFSVDGNETNPKDVSVNKITSYILPDGGTTISFVADNSAVSQGKVMDSFAWTLSDTNGRRIELADGMAIDISTFSVNPDVLPESSILKVVVENKAGSDTKTVALTKSPPGPTLAVSLFPVPRRTKSRWSKSTSVTSNVQLFGKTLESRIAFQWEYLGETYVVSGEIDTSDSPFLPGSTGPTKLGQHFNIAPQDLVVGTSEVKLIAFLEKDPSLRGIATVTVETLDFDVIAVINSGASGETIDASAGFALSASSSITSSDVPNDQDLVFEWFECQRSESKDFNPETASDCFKEFPQLARGLEVAELSPSELKSTLGSKSDEVYLSFGLRARSLTNRTDATRVWFRLIDSEDREPDILSSLLEVVHFETLDGAPILDLESVNSLQDIVVRPESSSDAVTWTFQLRRDEEVIALNEKMVLEGANRKGRGNADNLVFRGSALDGDARYTLILKLLNRDSKKSELEIGFKTAAFPELSCGYSGSPTGFADQTQFVVSAQVSSSSGFDYIYCFYILNLETNSRDLVGLGCSNVRVAKFSWPVVGRFELECELKTVTGETIRVEKTQQNAQVQVTARRGSQAVTRSNAESRAVVIKEQSMKLRDCKFSRNSICMLQMASTFPQLLMLSSRFPEDDAGAPQETLTGEELTADLCDLLRAMSLRTVFTPGDVLSAVESTASMSSLPPDFYDANSLLNCIFPLSLAVNPMSESAAQAPAPDRRLTDSLNFIANYSITAAANIAASTNRTRLLSDVDGEGGESALFALLLEELPMFSAHIALHNEGCGFRRAFDTSVAGGLKIQPPVRMYLNVLCGTEKDAELELRGFSGEQSNVKVSVCKEVMEDNLALTGSERFSIVVKQTDAGQFCSTMALAGAHSAFVHPIEISFPRQHLRGGRKVPKDCVKVRVPRLSAVPCGQSKSEDEERAEDSEPDPSPESESESTTSVSDVSRQVSSKTLLTTKIAAGSVEGLGTIRSTTNLNESKFLSIDLDKVLIRLEEDEVEFSMRGPGRVLAVYTRAPGDVPTGETVNLALMVGLMVAAVAVVAVGVATTQGQFIAGVPLAIDTEIPYFERDQFGRVWNPEASELQDVAGYNSDSERAEAAAERDAGQRALMQGHVPADSIVVLRRQRREKGVSSMTADYIDNVNPMSSSNDTSECQSDFSGRERDAPEAREAAGPCIDDLLEDGRR